MDAKSSRAGNSRSAPTPIGHDYGQPGDLRHPHLVWWSGSLAVAVACLIGVPLGLAAGLEGGLTRFRRASARRDHDRLSRHPLRDLPDLGRQQRRRASGLFGSQVMNVVFVIGITSGWRLPVDAGADPDLRERSTSRPRAARGDRVPDRREAFAAERRSAADHRDHAAIPAAIFAEAGLSFLGIGINEPVPSLGKMVADSRQYIQLYWHLGLFPHLPSRLAVLGFAFLGRWFARCT